MSFLEKRYVLTKFCSSFHCLIPFNVMEFYPYAVVFTFGMISLLPLVLSWCSWVLKVKKSLKFSGNFFCSWLYTNQQFNWLLLYITFLTLSIFNFLHKFLAPSFGLLKFRILVAFFCVFSIDSRYSFCLWPQIW